MGCSLLPISMALTIALMLSAFSAVLIGRVLRADAAEIVFVRNVRSSVSDPVNAQIYVMDVADRHRVFISPIERWGVKRWSPDGQVLAFIRYPSEPLQIMDTQTTPTLRQIARFAGQMAWSPDGQYLAYIRDDAAGHFLMVIRVDGTNERQLGSSRSVSGHAWSPDGRQIAYVTGLGMYLINVDGTAEQQLSVYAGHNPHWSPDGSIIAFQVMVDQQYEIFIIRADGTGARRLTFNDRDDSPVGWIWCDDGWRLLIVTDWNNQLEMWALDDAQGGFVRLLADVNLGIWGLPAISEDGRLILFSGYSRRVNGQNGLYIVGSNGRDLQRLTFIHDGITVDEYPAWRP